jgi:hypothetical protein
MCSSATNPHPSKPTFNLAIAALHLLKNDNTTVHLMRLANNPSSLQWLVAHVTTLDSHIEKAFEIRQKLS